MWSDGESPRTASRLEAYVGRAEGSWTRSGEVGDAWPLRRSALHRDRVEIRDMGREEQNLTGGGSAFRARDDRPRGGVGMVVEAERERAGRRRLVFS